MSQDNDLAMNERKRNILFMSILAIVGIPLLGGLGVGVIYESFQQRAEGEAVVITGIVVQSPVTSDWSHGIYGISVDDEADRFDDVTIYLKDYPQVQVAIGGTIVRIEGRYREIKDLQGRITDRYIEADEVIPLER